MNILFCSLIVIFRKWQRRRAKLLGIRIDQEVSHDWFDESRNFYFKLNKPARYKYQSLHLELLRLILANARQNHYHRLQDDLLRRPHEWVHENFIDNLFSTSVFVAYPLFQIKFRFDADASRLVGVHSLG